MGLDITAYRQLTPAPDGDPEVDDDVAYLPGNDLAFADRRAGLESDTYNYAESFGFRAGSYSGYNAWRSWLATVAGFKDDGDAWAHKDVAYPFAELIWFSDCEGTIGPTVSAKLFADFKANAAKAKGLDTSVGGYNFARYEEWMQAFEMAADGGAVAFH